MNILVVEDIEDSRVLLVDQLTVRGYRVEGARDGEDALNKISCRKPDLIVSDILMPKMDGYELCRRIKQDKILSHIPFIFYTATYTDLPDREFALSLGASAFIIKPACGDELIQIIEKLLAQFENRSLQIPTHADIDETEYDHIHSKVLSRKLDKKAKDLTINKQQLRIITDALPVLISQLDINHKYMYANKVHEEWCQRPLGKIIGCHIQDVLSDSTYKALRKYIEGATGGEQYKKEVFLQFPDGKERYIIPTFIPQTDDEGNIISYVSLITDITERKHAEIELELHRNHLEDLVFNRTTQLSDINKELEALCHSVSHELHATLCNIDEFSSVFEQYIAKLDTKTLDYLIRIRTSAKRMESVIDGQLSLSSIARHELTIQQVDMTKLAREVADKLKQNHPDRQLKLQIQEEIVTQGDIELLRIVLDNLFSNAWKFTYKQAAAKITMGAYKEGNSTVIYIRDNGVGFDSHCVDKLYTSFQRLHDEKDYSGTGIGLATVKRIIERHGGRVWAQGEPDKGACFYFSLPEVRSLRITPSSQIEIT